jgi:CRISPR/Cas system-associated protein Cas10 (large subunit of type III CRISPR-Cas system)
LLQKYLSFVPSDAYKSIPDVSLYDHSKTVVMFAHILYEEFKNFENKEKLYKSSTTTDDIISQIKVNLV